MGKTESMTEILGNKVRGGAIKAIEQGASAASQINRKDLLALIISWHKIFTIPDNRKM
jgi:hypothetical protein